MPGRVLLDTNIAIGFLAGDESVVKRVAEAAEVLAPVVAVGELYFGAHRSARAEQNLDRVREFVSAVSVVGVDSDTAAVYGRLKDVLRSKGRPIPDNDLWIAAIGMQHDLTIVTRDAHFESVDGLTIERW